MLELIPRIPLFKLSRRFGVSLLLPVSLTVSLTYRCNSRCRTCNIYTKKSSELSLDEYERIFRSIGKAPYWITFSGGEPFLREDIAEICKSAYKNCGPKIINIPSNGLLSERIDKSVREILDSCPDSNLIINLSVDGIGERHDEIRGVKGCFDKVMKTYKRLKTIKNKKLTVGIHTVISRYNVKEIPSVYNWIKKLNPDSYITEIAEERVELGTIGTGITPSLQDYSEAVDFISNEMKKWELKGIAKITRLFRTRYYQMVKKILKEKREVIPCYAAIASCQISPDGEVWDCCIKAESMGSLRDTDYDFRRVWFSDKAKRIRSSIKQEKCFCPLANASYTNMLFTPKYLVFGSNSK
jgi:MoaA/NifB/PqqE/SkfB family radical SAM enzyme